MKIVFELELLKLEEKLEKNNVKILFNILWRLV